MQRPDRLLLLEILTQELSVLMQFLHDGILEDLEVCLGKFRGY